MFLLLGVRFLKREYSESCAKERQPKNVGMGKDGWETTSGKKKSEQRNKMGYA